MGRGGRDGREEGRWEDRRGILGRVEREERRNMGRNRTGGERKVDGREVREE